MTASLDNGAQWLESERQALARVDLKPEARSVGRVEEIADGVARVSGLPEARLGELLRFEGGRMGYALSLEAEAVNAAIFDEAEAVGVGSLVSATGEVARVPVGPGLLGRVIDPLGRPLDRDQAVDAEAFHPIERAAPAIIDRALVSEPVATGVLAIDALFALGRGQRELIIGDRAIGKTAIAVDAIVNQKRSDLICVYVAVGQRSTAVERVIEAVKQYGAPSAARSSSLRRPRRPRCSGSRPSPASPSVNIFATRAAMRWSSSTTSPSTPRPIASSRFSPASRPAARPSLATSSTSMPACSSGPPNSPRSSAAAR